MLCHMKICYCSLFLVVMLPVYFEVGVVTFIMMLLNELQVISCAESVGVYVW